MLPPPPPPVAAAVAAEACADYLGTEIFKAGKVTNAWKHFQGFKIYISMFEKTA